MIFLGHINDPLECLLVCHCAAGKPAVCQYTPNGSAAVEDNVQLPLQGDFCEDSKKMVFVSVPVVWVICCIVPVCMSLPIKLIKYLSALMK